MCTWRRCVTVIGLKYGAMVGPEGPVPDASDSCAVLLLGSEHARGARSVGCPEGWAERERRSDKHCGGDQTGENEARSADKIQGSHTGPPSARRRGPCGGRLDPWPSWTWQIGGQQPRWQRRRC